MLVELIHMVTTCEDEEDTEMVQDEEEEEDIQTMMMEVIQAILKEDKTAAKLL